MRHSAGLHSTSVFEPRESKGRRNSCSEVDSQKLTTSNNTKRASPSEPRLEQRNRRLFGAQTVSTTFLKIVRGIASTALIVGGLLTQHVMRAQTAGIKLTDLQRNDFGIPGHEAARSADQIKPY